MNLVLVGYRGTGKSAVAGLLGQLLGRPVISLDAKIVEETGCSIPEIVAQRGWQGFRDLESSVCKQYAQADDLIIDCGGGIVEREENVAALRKHGRVFWLQASVDTIVKRIGNDSQRPSLTGTQSFTDEVSQVLVRRSPLYERMAHVQIDTDHRSIEEIAAQIVSQFAQNADAKS